MMKRLLLLLTLLCFPAASWAQQGTGIGIIVGDDIVTTSEIQQRLAMVIASSGPPPQEAQKRLLSQIVDVLIDETLYRREAKELSLTVEEDELAQAVRNLEQQNRIGEGQFEAFLKSQNIEFVTLQNQLEAQILRSKVLMRKVRPYIKVGDEEIKQYQERMLAGLGDEKWSISEIALPGKNSKDYEDSKQLATLIVKAYEKGTTFAELAKQYSHATTAEDGGELGWVNPEKLGDQLREEVEVLAAGNITAPIETENGIYLLRLNDRKWDASDKVGSTILLQQIFHEKREIGSEEEIPAIKIFLEAKKKQISSCKDVLNLIETLPAPYKTDSLALNEQQVHPDIKSHILPLQDGETTEVVETPIGFHLFTLCERQKQKIEPPNESEIRAKIAQDKMELKAKQYLRQLKRDTFIEVRI